ncbi:molybdopterin-dependent oxidoreductase [Pollutibacter soli]|uniref:molybdopterin-dependent oxidoreductase n=1 Tax=Pollutibacter soli TaxID=3034157 RepID=UPI0030138958
MTFKYIAGIFLIIGFSNFHLQSQTPAKGTLKISGQVEKQIVLTAEQVSKMKHVTAVLTDRGGKNVNYRGVSLQDLLGLAGVSTGSALRGENLAKYLIVKCADNYEVLFSLAEIDSSFTDRVIILADTTGGNPLPVDKGPFRLIVPGEKKPARSAYQVREFVVKFAK